MDLGRVIISFGIFFIILGVVVSLISSNISIPKLPGDIYIKRDNFVFYFPWVTSLIISIILTILLNLFWRK